MKEIHRLYVEYKSDLYHYLLGLTKDPNTADDLLSETFLKAIVSLPSFRGDSTIKTWLFGIARNLWLQHLKKCKPTVEYDEFIDYGMQDDLIQSALSLELSLRIKELLREMDDRTREVVMLRMNGHSYRVIADTLKLSEGSARVIEFRARRGLKETLSKEGYL